MDFVIIIWLVTAVALPLAIFAIAIINFTKKVAVKEILIKLSIAFFLYFLATFAVVIFGLSNIFTLLNIAGDSIPPDPEPFKTQHIVVGSLIVFGYALCGAFLCWFVKRDLQNSLRFITGNNKKLQSVFDTE